MLLEGYALVDVKGRPKRLREKIPLTYALACRLMQLVDVAFQGASNCHRRRGLCAAIALALGLSLRPGEYLNQGGTPVPLDKQVNSSSCFFNFGKGGDLPVYICDPHLYPPGESPTSFMCMSGHFKNDPEGDNGPRAVAEPPSPPGPGRFSCVAVLFEFWKDYPPLHNTYALSVNGVRVLWTDLRMLMHMLAVEQGLDPLRTVPHSLRSGALAQMELFDKDAKKAQGGWTSDCVFTYCRTAVLRATAATAAIHDYDACPIAQTVVLFNDHSEGTVYATHV